MYKMLTLIRKNKKMNCLLKKESSMITVWKSSSRHISIHDKILTLIE